MTQWYSFPCKIQELKLSITLVCGQSFRWREGSPGLWTNVLKGKLWTLRQDDDALYYTVTNPDDTSDASGSVAHLEAGDFSKHASTESCKETDDKYEAVLRDYFQLDRANLTALYEQWGAADSNFRKVAVDFAGVRVLRQDPVENLFSFICSSNNNITRISGMVEKLCSEYGKELLKCGGIVYYSFPSVKALAGEGVEDRLRELGFGYRAKYIAQTASYIAENCSELWLYSLRDRPYLEAKAELMKLCGVGAKVADCICLMSLDKSGAIPVDTHVWHIAAASYLPQLKQRKSLTDSMYQEIGNFFRDLWGDYAGWAQSVLFSADLKKFNESKNMVTNVAKDKGKSRKRKSNHTIGSTKQRTDEEN